MINNQIRMLGLIFLGMIFVWGIGSVSAQTVNAPSNLAAPTLEATSLTLSWTDNATDESYFKLGVTSDALSYDYFLPTANTNSYLLVGLHCNTNYSISLQAYRSADNTYSSPAQINVTTAACISLPPPSNLQFVSASYKNISLSWLDNTSAESAYELEVSEDAGVTWRLLGALKANLSAITTNDTLKCGTSYQFRLRAHSDLKEYESYSAYSNLLTASTTACLTTLATPTSFNGTATANSIQLTWVDNAVGETFYRLERSNDNGLTWSYDGQPNANATSYTVSYLNCQTNYQFRLRAWRFLDGTHSAYSTTLSLTTLACSNPIAPSNLTVSFVGTTASLSWTDNSANESSFSAERSTDGGLTWVYVGSTSANFTTLTDVRLTCNQSVQYRVSAYQNSTGNRSAYSNIASGTAGACTALVAPIISIIGLDPSYDLFYIEWTDSNQNGTSIFLEHSLNGGSWEEIAEYPYNYGLGTAAEEDLSCGTEYSFRLRTYREADNSYSPYSAVSTSNSYDCAAPLSEEICTFTPFFQSTELPTGLRLSANGQRAFVRAGESDMIFSSYSKPHDITIWDTNTLQILGTIPLSLAEFVVSADGTRVAFSSTSDFTGENPLGYEQIFLWDNGAYTQITANIHANPSYLYMSLSMSSSGERLAFVDGFDLSAYLWDETTGLQNIAADAPALALSGDGQKLAFVSYNSGLGNETGSLYFWDANGISSIGRPSDSDIYGFFGEGLILDETGSNLAYRHLFNSYNGWEIFTWNATDGFTALLGQIPNFVENADYADDLPIAWSADGQRLFFTSPRDLTGENFDGLITNAHGGEFFFYENGLTRQLTTNLDNGFQPMVYGMSQDGSRILAYIMLPAPTNAANQAIAEPYLVVGDCDALPMLAPSDLAATSASASSISLTWTDNAYGETEYRLERSSNAGISWSEIAVLPADTSSYSNTSLTCSTSYDYRVRAYRSSDAQSTAYSNSVTGTTSACPPLAPTALTLTSADESSINLAWTDNATNETAYHLERSTDGGTNWTEIAAPAANSTTYTDVATCGTLLYRLRAENAGSYSAYSNTLTVESFDCATALAEEICTFTPIYSPTIHPTSLSLSANGERAFIRQNTFDDVSHGYKYNPEDVDVWDLNTMSIIDTLPDTMNDEIVSSADGTRAFFMSRSNLTGANPENELELFLWEEGSISQLTTNADLEWYESLSANSAGTKLVFLNDNKAYLWEAGTGIQRIIPESSLIGNIAISGDGLHFAMSIYDNISGNDPSEWGELYLWDASNGLLRIGGQAELGESEQAFYMEALHLNEDASHLSFRQFLALDAGSGVSIYAELYVWNALDGFRPLLDQANNLVIHDDYADNLAAAWSASGERLYFSSSRDLTRENPDGYNHLLEDGEFFFLDNGQIRQITTSINLDRQPMVFGISNDGSRILAYTTLPQPTNAENYASAVPYVVVGECALPALLAPSNLAIASSSSTSINLSWNANASSADSYSLERSADAGITWSEIAQPAITSSSYTDSALACETSYDYRLRSHRASDNSTSAYSVVVTGTTALCAPSAPSSLNVSSSDQTSISLAWTDNATTETGYRLERSADSGVTWAEIAQPAADATSYSNAALTCNTSYQYRIRAYRSSDSQYSAYSNVVTASTTACPAPLAPTGLVITGTGYTNLALAWTDNASDETEYRLERSANAGTTWSEIATLAANATSYNDSSALCNSTYHYRVRVYRAGDSQYSAYSNVVSGTSNICITLNAPTNIQLTSNSQTSLTFTWTDNSTNESGYDLERSLNGTTWTLLSSLPADSSGYTDSGLNCSSAYYYRLRSNHLGTGSYSPYATSGLLSSATCPALVASVLSSTGATQSSISLSWTADSNGTSFTLAYYNGTTWVNLGIFPSSTTTYTQSGLICGRSYSYQVTTFRTVDSASVTSGAFSTNTAACPPLTAPLAPIVVNTEPTLVSLQIPALPSTATSMSLERSSDGSTWTNLGVVSSNYLDTAVTCGSSYQYRLVALRSSDGISSTSSSALAITDACPIPTVVGVYRNGLWVFVDSNNTVVPTNSFNFGDNTWQALVGDWDGDGVDGVGIYRNGEFVLRNIASADAPDNRFNFGAAEAGWQAIVGDWNGDGLDSIGLYKDGLFTLSDDNLNIQYRFNFGAAQAGWQVLAGDWDGNGADGIGLYKEGFWFLAEDVNNPDSSSQSISYGPTQAGWLAIVGDWNGDGRDSIGLYNNGLWRMRVNSLTDASETTLSFGQTGDTPLAIFEAGGAFSIP